MGWGTFLYECFCFVLPLNKYCNGHAFSCCTYSALSLPSVLIPYKTLTLLPMLDDSVAIRSGPPEPILLIWFSENTF